MRRWPGLFCIVLCAFAQQQPEFRAGTRLVQVDVVVRDSHGPVKGLTKDDFALFDKGVPQKIAVFAASSGRTAGRPIPLAPGEVSNRPDATNPGPSGEEASAATTVVLLDFLNSRLPDQSFARREVAGFVASMGDSDRMALLALKKNLVVLRNFTTGRNREQLTQAVEHLPFQVDEDQLPRERTWAEVQYWWQARIDITQHALEAVVRHLAGLPGRKNLVWVSDDFFYDPVRKILVWPDLLPMLKQGNIALYLAAAQGLTAPPAGADRGRLNPRMAQMVASRAPANDFARNAALRQLAESTGGLGFFDTNDLRGSLEKAMDDTAMTYTLGFYPSDSALDGTLHPLKVKVARKGVEVRYRDSYYASAADKGPGRQQAEQQAVPAIEQLLGDPLDATAIGLTAGPAQSGINLAVNLRDLRLDHEADRWKGSFDVAFEPAGRPMKYRTFALDLSEEEFRTALEKPYAISIPLPAGTAGQVRIVVRDRATGNAGSLLAPLK